MHMRAHAHTHTHTYLASKVCSVCLILHHDVHASGFFFPSVKPYSSIFQVPGRKKMSGLYLTLNKFSMTE